MNSYPQNSEEAERLGVYESWPKIPPKIRRAILLLIATTDEELEDEAAPSSMQTESISLPSTATNGNQ